MVTFEKTNVGVLRIILTAESRACFDEIEAVRDRHGIDAAFLALIECRLAQDWEVVRPEEVGALTASLILGDDVVRDDHGRLTSVGRVYWYPDYAVRDEIEEIGRNGFIEFVGVE